MKRRRNHDANPNESSSMPTSFPAAPLIVRSPETRFNSRSNQAAVPKTSEFAFFKKLKKHASERFDCQPIQREESQSKKLNSSKFGKVEEGTKMLVKTFVTPSEETNINKNCSEDFGFPLSIGKFSSKELGSVLSMENVMSMDSRLPLHVNHVTRHDCDPVLSPFGRAANNTEASLNKAFSAFESPCHIEDFLDHDSDSKRPRVIKIVLVPLHLSKPAESDQVGLFSGKRQKLRQLAHNSFPEIEELCSKGYNLTSMLLSRLLPWSNEKNSIRSAESELVERNSKSELFACSKSDIPSKKLHGMPTRNIMEIECMPDLENGTSSCFSDRLGFACSKSDIPSKKLHGMPTRNIMEIECMPYLENGTSSCFSDRLGETMLFNFGSPTKNYCSTLQKNLELPSCEYRRKNLTSCITGDSTFGFPFGRHHSYLPYSPFKEPDNSHDPHGSLPGREPRVLLLEWDPINMNETSLSSTCQNTNWTMIPAVQSSWDDQQCKSYWDESYGTLGVYSSPVRNHPQEFYTLMPPKGTFYDKHERGRSTTLEDEEMVPDLGYLPLSSINLPERVNYIGNCDYYEIACRGCETSDILPFPGNQLRFASKIVGEDNGTPSNGTHLSFAVDVEWKCLQSTRLRRKRYSSACNDLQFPENEPIYSNFLREDGFESSSGGSGYRSLIHSSEDVLNMHEWCRSVYFQIFHDKDKAYPLLLDNSSWGNCTEETYDGNI
ncbi:hypothetical protein COLO4_08165 [Corchorus olitorius]|uniref:Uncharacterized protein n=1 Tax=Corchorus olitorius TaxID=93759 RepID=A0A1R3KHA3_9ROSI|nr:hypothetical protein COLO4_08165 [Corchorus olitorius]